MHKLLNHVHVGLLKKLYTTFTLKTEAIYGTKYKDYLVFLDVNHATPIRQLASVYISWYLFFFLSHQTYNCLAESLFLKNIVIFRLDLNNGGTMILVPSLCFHSSASLELQELLMSTTNRSCPCPRRCYCYKCFHSILLSVTFYFHTTAL